MFRHAHADYFHGAVPVTSEMAHQETAEDYEKNTGPHPGGNDR